MQFHIKWKRAPGTDQQQPFRRAPMRSPKRSPTRALVPLPRNVVIAISELEIVDRKAFIVETVHEKLEREHERPAEIAPG